MPRNSVDEKHELLELWGILEVQKVWRAMEGRIPYSSLSEKQKNRHDWSVDILDEAGFDPRSLKELRNSIAHYDPDAEQWNVKQCSDVVRLLLDEILGTERFEQLWTSLQAEWSHESMASRRERQDLLRRFEQLFGGERDYADLDSAQKNSITHSQFMKCLRSRDRASHPNPPPTSVDVQEALEIFRTYSRNLGQVKKSKELLAEREKKALAREKASRARATRASIEATENARAERERLDNEKTKQETAEAKRIVSEQLQREQKRLKAAETKAHLAAARETRRREKLDQELRRSELQTWAREFHAAAMKANRSGDASKQQAQHLRKSMLWSIRQSVLLLIILSVLMGLSVPLALMFPLFWIIAAVPYVIYLLVDFLAGFLPTMLIVLLLAVVPILALSAMIREDMGWEVLTEEDKLRDEKES